MGEEHSTSTSGTYQEISASLTAGVTLLSSGHTKRALAHLNLAAHVSSTLGVNTPGVDASGLDLSASERRRNSVTDINLLQLCAEVHYYKALALQQLKDHAEAVKSYKRSIDVYLRTEGHVLAAAGMVGLAECYQELGDLSNQIRSWESARHLYRELKDVFNEAMVCAGLARTYWRAGQKDVCEQYIQECSELCRKVHSKSRQGELQAQCGWLYSNLKLFSEALVCFKHALHMLSRDRRAAASVLQNIGAVYNEMGRFSDALDYHKQASIMYGKLRLSSSHSKCLCNLAFAQSQLADYYNATNSYHQALSIAHSCKDKHLLFQASEGLGAVYYAMGQHSKATKYFKEALKVLDFIGSDTGLARERVMEKLSCVVEITQAMPKTRALNEGAQPVVFDSLKQPSREGAKPLGKPTTILDTARPLKEEARSIAKPAIGAFDNAKTSRGKARLTKQDSVDADLTAYMQSYRRSSASSEEVDSPPFTPPPMATSLPHASQHVRQGSLALGPNTRKLYTTVSVAGDKKRVKTEIISVEDAQNLSSNSQQATNNQNSSSVCLIL